MECECDSGCRGALVFDESGIFGEELEPRPSLQDGALDLARLQVLLNTRLKGTLNKAVDQSWNGDEQNGESW